MYVTLMIQTGKKYRKIAKGQINIYNRYFNEDKKNIDKWIHLELFETQLEQMGHNTNILKAALNQGKIFMRAKLIDDVLHEQNKKKEYNDNITIRSGFTVLTQHKNYLKNVDKTKEKIVYNKTERLRSVTEQNNEFLRNLKNMRKLNYDEIYEDVEEDYGIIILILVEPVVEKEVFDDNLSDISISIIDENEDNHIAMDEMNLDIDNIVSNIKMIYENKIDDM